MKGKAEIIRRLAVAAMCVAGLATATNASAGPASIVVSDAAGLQSALAVATAGQRILMRSGTYRMESTVAVPNGVSLEGSGVMQGVMLPTGFEAGTETKIVALSALKGDLVTLGHGASLRALAVEDVDRPAGNAISARSRRPNDSMTASIVECEIVNPNRGGGDLEGPSGAGIVVLTRNPSGPNSPAPDTGAAITVSLTRSIVHSTGGGLAVFAANSAPSGRLAIDLRENVLRGRLDVIGGVSRGDEVTGASVTIDSADNLYVPAADFAGWTVVGGGTPPPNVIQGGPGASSNQVTIDSTDDRIEGTPVGIQSLGGRRFAKEFGANNDNRVDLNIHGLTLNTLQGGRDFFLAGASWLGQRPPALSPGDRNTVSVFMRDTTGSGPRGNVYQDNLGPVVGLGNRLQFVGTASAFVESNNGIDPLPPARFFTG